MVSSESLLFQLTTNTLDDVRLTRITVVVILNLCIVLLAARATLLPYAMEVATDIH
jgi:hypothetical protein